MDEKTFQLMYSSKGSEWYTPLSLYENLNDEFHFTTDVCAEHTNRLGCKYWFTKDTDGLNHIGSWVGNVFCNPPYGREVKKWVAKCAEYPSYRRGLAVMLIPARTDTSWFHEYMWKKPSVEIRFIRGRLKFENPEHKLNTAPFPSMVVVFK